MALKLTRRVTSPFIQAIPPQIQRFDAYMYAIVKRKIEKEYPNEIWGIDARIDPCILDWDHMSIQMTMPEKINYGIKSFEDLDPHFFEAIEAAFLSLMHNTLQCK